MSQDTLHPFGWCEAVPAPPGDRLVIMTGNTPDGTLHLGALREVLIGDALARVWRRQGKEVRLVFVSYDRDPLKKRYPFLPKEYDQYVDVPLNEIPSLHGGDRSYADENLRPFLDGLEDLGVTFEHVRTSA